MSERDEFEAWAKGRFYLDRIGGESDQSDEYAFDTTDAAWKAWLNRPIAEQAEPLEWQIEVAGPAGYVRFETFKGETLEAALDSVRKQNFCPAPDEDGFVTMKVKV